MRIVIYFNKKKSLWGPRFDVINEAGTSYRFSEHVFEVTYPNNDIECYPMQNIEKVVFKWGEVISEHAKK